MQPVHGRLSREADSGCAAGPEPRPGVAAIERWPEGAAERAGLVPLDRNERLGLLPDWFLAALRERVTHGLAATYPAPYLLHRELAETLDLPPEHVLVTPGTDAALRAVFLAFARPGDAVVHLDPTYAMVPVYARMFEACSVAAGYDAACQLDREALVAAVVPGVRLVVVANPNQPTGTLLPDRTVEELLERCERVGALLVLDEAYHPFSGVTALPLVGTSPNLLVLRTYSKAGGLAGLRVGFAAGSREVIRALVNVRSAGEVNALALEAARVHVAHPEVMAEYAAEVEAGRAALRGAVAEFGVEVLPSRANFVALRLPPPHEPAAVAARLLAAGWIVRGSFSGACLAGCIRVTLGPPELMERFSAVLAATLAPA